MQYANEVMNQFYADKKERWNYEAAVRYASDRATMWEAGMDKGRAEGILIGEKRGKLQTAKNMKAKNFDAETIREITGLTAEQIAEL